MNHKNRDAKIIQAYADGMTMKAIGEQLGLTRQRVFQILRSYNVPKQGKIAHKLQMALAADDLGNIPDVELARRLGISSTTVLYARREKGIPRYEMPIGCDDCKTHPYAKGLCRSCYLRLHKRQQYLKEAKQ